MAAKGLWALSILVMALLIAVPAVPADPTNAAERNGRETVPEAAGAERGLSDPVVRKKSLKGARAPDDENPRPENPGAQAPPAERPPDVENAGRVKVQAESGVTDEPVTPETRRRGRLLDRRWISDQNVPKRSGTSKIPMKELSLLSWQNETQKSQCESYLRRLKEDFIHARFYSVQGDPCKTAEYAESYLDLVTICRSGCPDEFLKRNGHSDKIIRNLGRLKILGKEDCLGPK